MKRQIYLLAAVSFLMFTPSSLVFSLESPNNQTPIIEQPSSDHMVQHTVSDKDLTTKIKQAVSADEELSHLMQGVDVKVDKGVVTLSGKVKSQFEKAKIESKIRSIAAGQQVVDKMTIKDGDKVHNE